MVLFGGYGGSFLGDTWTYQATATTISTYSTVSQWKVLVGLILFHGTLSATGQGIAGQMVTFNLNGPVRGSCTATTDSQGPASCSVVVRPLFLVLLIHSFSAAYGGSANYEASSATGTVHFSYFLG